jgi:hypothetical protein
MVRILSLVLATLASGCASLPKLPSFPLMRRDEIVAPDGVQARIAEGVVLTLPQPPNYPDERTIVQTGRAQYGDRQGAFDAVVSLSPDRVEIVLAMAGGPRLATIDWDAQGVREERAVFAPDSVPVENILADIFMTAWPSEAVAESLPDGLALAVSEGGVRTIRNGEDIIVEIAPDASNPARTVVRNAALGYEVTLITQSQD